MKALILVFLVTFTISLADADDGIPTHSGYVGIKARNFNRAFGEKSNPIDDYYCPRKTLSNMTELEGYNPPASFDARTQWPQCESISRVWTQGGCEASWAIPIADVLRDRLCIHKNMDFLVSPEDIISCCTYTDPLGDIHKCGSCANGDAYNAFNYFADHGVCSGGIFGETGTCKPYSIDPATYTPQPTPKCSDSCTDSSYEIPYEEDLVKGGTGCYRLPKDERAIMYEIENNGPVVTGFNLYNDYIEYTGGVYHHIGNGLGYWIQLGRIIGWGTENNTPYWLMVGYYGEEWGEGGTIKMYRGDNHCGIGNNFFAALP